MNYHRYKSFIKAQSTESIIESITPVYDSTDNTANNRAEVKTSNSIINEVELVRALYGKISSVLYPYVIEVLDSYDYIDSPIYDNAGISRETLAQLVSRVLDLAETDLDEVGEIRLDELPESYTSTNWSKNNLLHAIVEVIILNNIFMYRRPRMRILYDRYNIKDGKYNGMNYN
jgi:hypothetical protein